MIASSSSMSRKIYNVRVEEGTDPAKVRKIIFAVLVFLIFITSLANGNFDFGSLVYLFFLLIFFLKFFFSDKVKNIQKTVKSGTITELDKKLYIHAGGEEQVIPLDKVTNMGLVGGDGVSILLTQAGAKSMKLIFSSPSEAGQFLSEVQLHLSVTASTEKVIEPFSQLALFLSSLNSKNAKEVDGKKEVGRQTIPPEPSQLNNPPIIEDRSGLVRLVVAAVVLMVVYSIYIFVRAL